MTVLTKMGRSLCVCIHTLCMCIMFVCSATRLCVSLFTSVCICGCYLTFRTNDSLQTNHGVRGPARLLSWEPVLERADLLSVSSSDCWDIAFASSLSVSVFHSALLYCPLCTTVSLKFTSFVPAISSFCQLSSYNWDDIIHKKASVHHGVLKESVVWLLLSKCLNSMLE